MAHANGSASIGAAGAAPALDMAAASGSAGAGSGAAGERGVGGGGASSVAAGDRSADVPEGGGGGTSVNAPSVGSSEMKGERSRLHDQDGARSQGDGARKRASKMGKSSHGDASGTGKSVTAHAAGGGGDNGSYEADRNGTDCGRSDESGGSCEGISPDHAAMDLDSEALASQDPARVRARLAALSSGGEDASRIVAAACLDAAAAAALQGDLGSSPSMSQLSGISPSNENGSDGDVRSDRDSQDLGDGSPDISGDGTGSGDEPVDEGASGSGSAVSCSHGSGSGSAPAAAPAPARGCRAEATRRWQLVWRLLSRIVE